MTVPIRWIGWTVARTAEDEEDVGSTDGAARALMSCGRIVGTPRCCNAR